MPNNYDDIFENVSEPGQPEESFDKEAWVEQKQAERQRVYEKADAAAADVCANGGKFRAFLETQTRFDRYSVTNALLIHAHMPGATRINDYGGWKAEGVAVKRHQSSFPILEPGDMYRRDDGTTGVSYNVKYVFDISQTTARNRSQPVAKVDDRTLLKALINNPPVPFHPVDDIPGGVGALYDHDQQVIFVRRGMDSADIFRCTSMELACAEMARRRGEYNRDEMAFPAYCVSYMLCKKNGVDVSGFKFTELPASLREGDPQERRAALSEIRDTAAAISSRMYRVLEQNKGPKSKEQER